jgi:hypothetical protein
VRPVTWTGSELLVVEPFPSWPWVLSPQHSTPPPVVTAQADPVPTDTAIAVVLPLPVPGAPAEPLDDEEPELLLPDPDPDPPLDEDELVVAPPPFEGEQATDGPVIAARATMLTNLRLVKMSSPITCKYPREHSLRPLYTPGKLAPRTNSSRGPVCLY